MMFGWLPLVIYLFSRIKPTHHAVIAGFLLAWMYLPQAIFKIPVIPAYNKISAAGYGILLGAYLFDRERLLKFRPHLADLPIFLWCLSPFCSSVSNGLGMYDGLSATEAKIAEWFIPYFIGRTYFGSLENLKDLTTGLLLGALLYMPLCWFEFVLSPQLHRMVYGFHPHEFGQAKRAGGWRPVIFMKHGLMTSMWMVSGSLSGVCLFLSKNLGKNLPLLNLPTLPLLSILLCTTFLMKSFGALALLVAALTSIFVVTRFRTMLPVLALGLIPLAYESTRGTGWWDAQNLIKAAASASNEDRAESLAFRIRNENLLIEKALQRGWFGWGGWQRSFIFNERGVATSVPDGLWIVALGQNGLTGLATLTLTLVLPQFLFIFMFPPKLWRDPRVAAVAPLPLLLGVFMVDNLFNDMFNPTMLLSAGGITALFIRRLNGENPLSHSQNAAAPDLLYKMMPRLM